MATYTPSGGSALNFRLLIEPPERATAQTMSERVVPGGNSIVDKIGKTVTKIRGTARFDGYAALKTFEGAVGTSGSLVYSEEPGGLNVEFVSLTRNRVTPPNTDIHLAAVEFWIIPGGGGVRAVSLSAQAVGPVSGTVNFSNMLSARVSYGFDQRTGECRILTPIKPACTYDDVLTVTMGAGTNNIVRFAGVIRDFQYQDGSPAVTTVAHGYLIRAIEYENGEETSFSVYSGIGGLLIQDLTGSMAAHSSAIVQAVLTKANVPYTAGNIGGSSVLYGAAGGLSAYSFLWHSGGHIASGEIPLAADQGETALTYIERYDAIDAEVVSSNTGGRYRTFEGLGGTVKRQRVGGRPQGTPAYTLTEGTDIFSGNFTRSISNTRNYFVVKGMDRGQGFGPLNYGLQESNPFQPVTTKHTYAASSDMIERATTSTTDPGQASDGMSCQLLATALALEFNREIVSGWLETWHDDPYDVAQTHLVQGGPGGTVGALGLAENVWVQSLDISVDNRGFTQRISYLGGGLPES